MCDLAQEADVSPRMLAGDAATQFCVTGATAGLYARDGDEFRRVKTDTGDTLPETITTAWTSPSNDRTPDRADAGSTL